ncbi:hypothetical protein F511_24353 [Dorcoceras hygrometricum]|uniref:Uncharacterized protein n=1 Tax=Dorcoceras hygrometricum TaxID=472368 RepID=A0A2Z7D997_9LAMI|nr:hypothetical protein F511_24353 [Dorcoceras hygrometricum]
MASSLIISSHHIDFDSVFGIDDAGLAQMFESLIATGLKNFLGCPAVLYESALIEFFENSSVRDGMVVSTIKVPKDLVFDARSSISKEQVSISCLKKEMKIEYRLLSDILAKTIYVKAAVSPHISSVASTDFVAQRITLVLDQHSFSSSSSNASMHFDDHDTATTAFSRPFAATPDVTEALALLQASIDKIRDRDGDAKLKYILLMHLHGTEQRLTTRLDDQDRVLGALRKDSHSQKQLLSLDIKSSHKQLSTQVAAAAMDTVDVRRVVKELEAKVTSLDEQVAATRNDLLEFSAHAQQTLNVITDQLSELVAYINHGGNDKKGEVVSSSRPQPPPDDQNRDSGIAGGGGDTDRSVVERLLTADRQRQRERSRGHSSGSYKRRR